MARRVVGLTAQNAADLPDECRHCAFWELSPAGRHRVADRAAEAGEKQRWLVATSREWGACGLLVYVDDVAAGYLSYAPPAYVPRADSFATSPPAADSLLLMTGRIRSDFAGQGLGRVLMQAAAREATRQGIRALEAFGATTVSRHTDPAGGHCLLPVGYLTAVGFAVVRPHPRAPRLRLDVRTAVSWRADVESAIERLFRTIPSPATTAADR